MFQSLSRRRQSLSIPSNPLVSHRLGRFVPFSCTSICESQMVHGTVFCKDEYSDYSHVKAYLSYTNICYAFYLPNMNLIFASRIQAVLPQAAQWNNCWEVAVHLLRWSTALIEIKLQSFGGYVPQILSKWSLVNKCHLHYTKSEIEDFLTFVG